MRERDCVWCCRGESVCKRREKKKETLSLDLYPLASSSSCPLFTFKPRILFFYIFRYTERERLCGTDKCLSSVFIRRALFFLIYTRRLIRHTQHTCAIRLKEEVPLLFCLCDGFGRRPYLWSRALEWCQGRDEDDSLCIHLRSPDSFSWISDTIQVNQVIFS